LRSVRLLPVVIFAALALLLFKGIGLVTNGGYILTGPMAVQAAGAEAEGGEAALPAEAGAPTDPTLTDTSPVLEDDAPTLATKAETAGHGETAAHADASEAVPDPSSAADEGHATTSDASSASTQTADVACPPAGAEASSEDAGHGGAELTDNIGNAMAVGCPSVESPVNEHGDALPQTRDADGKVVPLEAAAGDNSEEALLARLSERRAELDKREADIAMRTALLEAAEKRLDERTRALSALEAKVAALVDEKQAAEEEGFKAVVSMYEGMKPKDAAKIFDTLSMQVLLKVARAMSPRKMSPILAAMSADPAQKLTTAMAATENTDVVTANAGENLAQLPQIVGQ
jgi:flagellar motility protein MotE (MotC chaperone)